MGTIAEGKITLSVKISVPEDALQAIVAQKTHGAWDGLENLNSLPDGTLLIATQMSVEEVESKVNSDSSLDLPEPDSYLFQHEETGLTQCVDAQQVEWGFEGNNPRWKRVGKMFTEEQLQKYAKAVLEAYILTKGK